ncbi:MAG: hypothetical protein JKY93_04075 [Gammaproteobacteria bacterium]|nr:hypothetical protein [Gammaproteobacteria bacterium]
MADIDTVKPLSQSWRTRSLKKQVKQHPPPPNEKDKKNKKDDDEGDGEQKIDEYA